ncbi:MAG: methionyl-tRNA formyltransferase [Desulfobacteraceae bacterium 4572_88]|nr:MAG: methionyl-tRNA formyltransferase [Desulfobacteraceae bacterium 4572_88]
MNKKFRIVFMGTPNFSVFPLYLLHKNGYEVPLVVTQPDRRKGRGRKLLPPPVKVTAVELGYEVAQPASMKSDAFAERIRDIRPDLFVVVAFGHILPASLLSIPRLGAINIHASLLPKYRGPAPIQWAIIKGEKESGVTTMFMDKGLDTGDILLTEKTDITPDDTAASLHDRLSLMGADLLIRTLKAFEDEEITPVLQDHSQATYAPMLSKKDGHLNWKKSANALESFIRGMTPWPGAFTFHGDNRLKIFKAELISSDSDAAPGTVLRGFSNELRIATGDGALSVLEIQGASGKRLLIRNFLRGHSIPVGTVLT